jgi:hypothetical protein
MPVAAESDESYRHEKEHRRNGFRDGDEPRAGREVAANFKVLGGVVAGCHLAVPAKAGDLGLIGSDADTIDQRVSQASAAPHADIRAA